MSVDLTIRNDGLNVPPPICDVCEKPVDKIVSMRDGFREVVSFRVFCHGEVETVQVDLMDLHDALGEIHFGRAFVREKQLGP
jgi:hypothetical protein